MAAIYANTASTWYDNTDSPVRMTVVVDFSETTYSSNLPDAAYRQVPDEEGLLEGLKAQRRLWSIEAQLELKRQHHLRRPATRTDAQPCYAHRPQSQRRSAKAIRNWRPR